MTTTALSDATMGFDLLSGDCESFDVVYVDELGPQSTTVLASGHDDAADQVAFDGVNVEKTIRRRDGDEADHTVTVIWTVRPLDDLAASYAAAA
jgi:hypothetical protein